ncbi:hypothetical protein FHG64_05925 [Antarcticibacterium flavum]|uniref:YtxH domain-containing protein n=1 Tax=Antarcticibacterium flavum TaxID=2058175 RepID=A0A5B7X2W9_9FLAO|nr:MULTISPECIES: hypothetical protein [Antarcticibacterium]MCM4160935.1 hypothetical protein [Antarcticibacterium sp. W02-3]QCY68978.1 hypothetical protein FHG64_05925 [Antarcticibacterium flavum]
MKKSILILAAAFTFSSFFTSCRETTNRGSDVEVTDDMDDLDDVGDDLEDAADDVGRSIEEGANEVEREVRSDDY